jgi:predicted nucleic acid-binding protein
VPPEERVYIEIDEDVAWHASRAARALKPASKHIGDNDCWIAGTAMSKALAIVTRKVKHISRLPALECVQY